MTEERSNASVLVVERVGDVLEGSAFMVEGSAFMVEGSAFMVESLAFMVEGSTFMVEGSTFMVEGSTFVVEGSEPEPGCVAVTVRVAVADVERRASFRRAGSRPTENSDRCRRLLRSPSKDRS
jgi:hypothetical protein